jgi:hypothetical protein
VSTQVFFEHLLMAIPDFSTLYLSLKNTSIKCVPNVISRCLTPQSMGTEVIHSYKVTQGSGK